jgi:hypothetical protein
MKITIIKSFLGVAALSALATAVSAETETVYTCEVSDRKAVVDMEPIENNRQNGRLVSLKILKGGEDVHYSAAWTHPNTFLGLAETFCEKGELPAASFVETYSAENGFLETLSCANTDGTRSVEIKENSAGRGFQMIVNREEGIPTFRNINIRNMRDFRDIQRNTYRFCHGLGTQ